MNLFMKRIFIFTMAALLSYSAVCQENLLTNGSFETPAIPDGSSYIELPDCSPWSVSAVYYAAHKNPAIDGGQSLYVYAGNCQQAGGTIAANTVYKLSFYFFGNDSGSILVADSEAQNAVSLASVRLSEISDAANQWHSVSLVFDSAERPEFVGQDLQVRLSSGGQVQYDGVRVLPFASTNSNLLANSGFESPAIPDGSIFVEWPDVFPWSVSADYHAVYKIPAIDGGQSLYMFIGNCQQDAGAIAANTVYELSFYFWGNTPDSLASVDSFAELLAYDESQNAVQLALVRLSTVSDAASQWHSASLVFDSVLRPDVAGQALRVKLSSGGQIHYDGVKLKTIPWNPGLNASPVNGSSISYPFDSYLSQTVPLSWQLPAPSGSDPVVCDVYYGTDPVFLTKVVDRQAAHSVEVPVLGLGTFYWRVDVIDPMLSDLPFKGRLMQFTVDTYIPIGDGVNMLDNPGFELPVIPQGQNFIENPALPAWTVTGYSMVHNSASLARPVAEGSQCLYIYGGACSQNAGTIEAGCAYALNAKVLVQTIESAPVSSIALLAADSGQEIELKRVGLDRFVSEAFIWYDLEIAFDTANLPDVIGQSLVVRINSGGLVNVDDVRLVRYPSLGASPAHYIAMDVPGTAVLSWNGPAPVGSGPISYDVYLGTQPLAMTQILDGGTLDEVPVNFSHYGTYYWLIGVTDPDANDGKPVYGPLMSFDVIDRCQGARRVPGFTYLAADLNQDCEVNLLDICILAGAWLTD